MVPHSCDIHHHWFLPCWSQPWPQAAPEQLHCGHSELRCTTVWRATPTSVVAVSLLPPVAINNRTISTWPFWAAPHSGMPPRSTVARSVSDPLSTNRLTTSMWPRKSCSEQWCTTLICYVSGSVCTCFKQQSHGFHTHSAAEIPTL